MLNVNQMVCWVGLLFVMLIQVGCGSEENKNEAQGFATPVEALDAYGKALEKGDEAAFRKIAARFKTALEGLDAIVAMQSDMKPSQAASANLKEMSKLQGFGGVAFKRFATEIDGDDAVIVQVFEDSGGLSLNDRFRKWMFEKSGGQWYLSDSKFGDAKDLPSKYAWDKNISDVSDVMRDFVSGFDGTSEKVEAALAKYAKGVETNMGLYNLKSPTITAKEEKDGKECYTLKVRSGSIAQIYKVCWQGQKITSITSVN